MRWQRGREGNGRGVAKVRFKADRAQDKKGDGRAMAAPDARKRSNLLEGSKRLFTHKFHKIFYAKQTHLDIHRTFAGSSPGSLPSPLQTPEDLEMGKLSQSAVCV